MNKKEQKYYKKLEIFLITYNRAFYLDRTLAAFIKSPFLKCKFTILDNCSTDSTPQICEKYRKKFPNLVVRRHKKNIGGAINYLRAVEIAEAEYTWIICDDDLYDFSFCADIIDVIENSSHDLISVGNGVYKFTRRGISTTTQELVRQNEMYYMIHGFIPALVFRTELFNSECIQKVSIIIKDIYQHLYFVHSTVERNCTIYISKKELLLLDPGTARTSLNPFFQFSSWVGTCMIIPDKKVRKRVIYNYFLNNKLLFMAKLVYYIYYEKVLNRQGRFDFGKEGLFAKFLILCAGFSGFQFIILMMLIPLFIIPRFMYKFFGKVILTLYYKGNIPADKNPESRFDPGL